jgi:hypothetical protein
MKTQEEIIKTMSDLIIEPLREDNQELTNRVAHLEESLHEAFDVVKLYKSLVNEGAIYVNTYSQDCDGVSSEYRYTFTDVDEYFMAEKHFYEQDFEGAHSWNVVRKSDLIKEEGTFGHGWDIK